MKETLSKKETPIIIGAGVIIGIIAVALVYFGNPANMGFCIACFLRDTSGALGFHSAAAVQYIRPEIVGLVLGSCILALATKEFKPRGGSAPVTRFVIGMFVMIGCNRPYFQTGSRALSEYRRKAVPFPGSVYWPCHPRQIRVPG